MERRSPLTLVVLASLSLSVPVSAAEGQTATPPAPVTAPVTPVPTSTAPSPTTAPAAAPTSATTPESASATDRGNRSVHDEMTCRMMKVTGSRVRKEKVCSTRGTTSNSQEWLRNQQDRGANEGSAAVVNGG